MFEIGVFSGEWTTVAWLGRLLIALAFSSALFSAISYLSNLKLGRKLFYTHIISTFSAIALILLFSSLTGTNFNISGNISTTKCLCALMHFEIQTGRWILTLDVLA